MFSEMIRTALEQEVVGQEDAVNSVARGVTRLASSLTPSERSWCSYLLVGPPGTGRGHLVRSVARTLFGHEDVLTINCKVGGHADPWAEFLRHLSPLLAPRPMCPARFSPSDVPLQPLHLVLVQDLERAHKDLHSQLAYLLESGQEILPGGQRLELDGCLFFFTSGLCTDRILDQARIGFPGSTGEGDGNGQGTLAKVCREEAEKAFGIDLLSQFDDLLVFQRLDGDDLAGVLDRHFARMNRWLSRRCIRCELRPSAKQFLLDLTGGETQGGAHDLMRVHRDEVEFPVADLLVSGALRPGGVLELDHRPGETHLHFSVGAPEQIDAASIPGSREIPVTA